MTDFTAIDAALSALQANFQVLANAIAAAKTQLPALVSNTNVPITSDTPPNKPLSPG